MSVVCRHTVWHTPSSYIEVCVLHTVCNYIEIEKKISFLFLYIATHAQLIFEKRKKTHNQIERPTCATTSHLYRCVSCGMSCLLSLECFAKKSPKISSSVFIITNYRVCIRLCCLSPQFNSLHTHVWLPFDYKTKLTFNSHILIPYLWSHLFSVTRKVCSQNSKTHHLNRARHLSLYPSPHQLSSWSVSVVWIFKSF